MKITEARVIPYTLQLRQRYTTATGATKVRSGFLFRIDTDAGTSGWGDAAPWSGYTPDAPEAVHDRLRALAAGYVGVTLDAVLDSVADLAPELPTCVAAVETATSVAAAAGAGVSLATHLASKQPRAALLVHAVITDVSPSDIEEAGRAAAAAGYPACKLKVGGRQPEDDIDRIRALRRVIGPDVGLRLDANGAWGLDQASAVLQDTAATDIEYVEDPVADWEAMAALRERVDVPLAVDQLMRVPGDLARARRVAAVAVLKPSVLGGPVRTLELAAAAREAGLRVVFGSLLESAVGLTAAIHTAAAWGRPEEVAGLATGEMLATDVAQPPPVTNGAVTVPSGPGLGITLDEGSEASAPQLSEGGAR